MQKQTIRKAISAKMDEWLESINDTSLAFDVKKSLLVSGGSIASMFLGEAVNDYDVYIQDREVLKRLVAYYTKPYPDLKILDGDKKEELIKEFQGDITKNSHDSIVLRTLKPGQIKIKMDGGGGYKVDWSPERDKDGNDKPQQLPKYRPLFFSPNAISLSDDIQIVNRFFGTPGEIHKTFDFIHATNFYTTSGGVVTNNLALESLLTKTLYYQGSQYPVTSVIRSKKFINRGFRISAGEMMKMMFQISQLDLTNMDTLEEQLIGVDVAYFSALIEALRNKYEADPEFKLGTEYFNELIDRIFRDSDNG